MPLSRVYARVASSFSAAVLAGCQSYACGCPIVGTNAATPSEQTLAVGRPGTARIAAGATIATVAFAAASSGTGTLRVSGSDTPTPESSASTIVGTTGTVPIPGTAIATVTIAPSAAATYAALPVISFTLPSGSPTANESFMLDIEDPAIGPLQIPVEVLAATTSATGISLAPTDQPIYAPYPADAPPILPITYDGNVVRFVLYETPVQSATPAARRR